MTQLRSQMKVILWILVVAFLATIVFSWGMGGFKSSQKPGVVAEINDNEITYEGFEALLKFTAENAARQSGGQMDETQTQRLREDTWDKEVERLVKADDIRRLGLKVTDRQIAYIVENYPPNEIQQVETFQRDGKFDMELYQNFLRDPQALNYLLNIEKRVEEFLLNQELNFHVSQGIDIPIDEVKDEYLRGTASGKLKFIFLSKGDFKVDSSEITDKMKRHYYQLFAPSRYKNYAQRRFAYVKFTSLPTAVDTTDILQEAQEIKKDYREGLDFAELAKQYSQDTGTKDKGGDLDWFDREAMAPEFSNAAFNAQKGELVGPVQTSFGFHIILVEDKRVENGIEQVKARHILLNIKPSADTREQTYTDAYNFSQEAKNKGFTEMAREYGLTIDTTKAFSEAGYIQGLGRMRMAAEFCLNKPVGTLSDVYPIPDGYIVFQITEEIEESLKPYEEVESSIHKKLSDILQQQKVWDRAAELRAKIETPDDLMRVAAVNDLTLYMTEDSIKVDDKLPDGLKKDKEFLTQAFRLEEGELSDIIQTNQGCYIACMEKKSPFNEDEYLANHAEIYQKLLSKQQEQTLDNWTRELRIAADIKDYRYKYFRDF